MRRFQPRTEVKQYDTGTVFAAAAAAYRLTDGKYIKSGAFQSEIDGSLTQLTSNREHMSKFIDDPASILEEDRELGEQIRRHYQGLSFKILSGKFILNDIETKALNYASNENVTEREFGLIAYLPEGYNRDTARKSVEDRVKFATGGYIGKIGDKVTVKLEVLKCFYSQNWGVFFITAITEGDQAVFFSLKHELTAGINISIAATVKSHENNQTRLNRAKILSK
jgi:hypothetical protein